MVLACLHFRAYVHQWESSRIEVCQIEQDLTKNRSITVEWDKVCKPVKEGGLGIKRLNEINNAMLMKLAWEILSGKDKFAVFMRSKYFTKDGEVTQSHRVSSIWPGIRNVLDEVTCRSQWVVGDGSQVDLWRHNWLGNTSLKVALLLDRHDLHGFNAKVQCLVEGNEIIVPTELADVILSAGLDTDSVLKGEEGEEDYMVWCVDNNGCFSVKSAFDSIRNRSNEAPWCSFIWAPFIQPKLSATAWNLIRNGVASDSRAQTVGVSLASCCRACYNGEDVVDHVLWQCIFVQNIWNMVRLRFRSHKPTKSLRQAMIMERDRSPLLKQLWCAAVVGGMTAIWQQRNLMVMDDARPKVGVCFKFIKQQVQLAARISSSNSFCNALEMDILDSWDLASSHGTGQRILECRWLAPEPRVVKINTDGAASDLTTGIGIVCRNHLSEFLCVAWRNIGLEDSYYAECTTLVTAGEIAVNQGWQDIWIESDAEAVVSAFRQGKTPWRLRQRWNKVISKLSSLMLSAVWREANFTADRVSKFALNTPNQELVVHFGKPDC